MRHRRRRVHGDPHRERKVTTIDGREESPATMTPDLVLGERQAAPVRRRPLQRHVRRHPRHAGDLGPRSPPLRHLVARPRAQARHPHRDATASRSTRPSSTRHQPNVDWFNDIPSTAAIYLDPDGTPRDVGSTLRNPDLARTYSASARRGVDWFYDGAVAGAMARAAQNPPKAADANHAWRPGLMTRARPSRYQAIERRADPHRLPRPRRLGHGPAVERRLDGRRGAEHPRGLPT